MAVGDDEFDAEGGAVVGAEFEAYFANGDGAFAASGGDDGAEVGGRGRELAEDVVLNVAAELLFAGGPLGLCCDAEKRIGEAGDGGEFIEIGREFAGAADPLFPGFVVGVESAIGWDAGGFEEGEEFGEGAGGVFGEEGQGEEEEGDVAHGTDDSVMRE